MKVTRKVSHEMPKAVERPKSEEIAPSLRMRDLPSEIEGLEPGKEFEAHIKGRCISHEHQKGESSEYLMGSGENKDKERHHYEVEVHDFEHKGGKGGEKKKKSSRDEVSDAMDKYDKDKASEKKKEEEAKAKGE